MSHPDRIEKMRALWEKILPDLKELQNLFEEDADEKEEAAFQKELKMFTDGLPRSFKVSPPLKLRKPGA